MGCGKAHQHATTSLHWLKGTKGGRMGGGQGSNNPPKLSPNDIGRAIDSAAHYCLGIPINLHPQLIQALDDQNLRGEGRGRSTCRCPSFCSCSCRKAPTFCLRTAGSARGVVPPLFFSQIHVDKFNLSPAAVGLTVDHKSRNEARL